MEDVIQYFDENGTNHRALVVATEAVGPSGKPAVTLVTVLAGRVATFSSVPHREERMGALPDREVKNRKGRVISIIRGERRRTPGLAFWME